MSDSSAAVSSSPAKSWGSAPQKASPLAWRALIVLLIGMFMSLIDTTIVNVALQTIREHVNGAGQPAAGEDVLSWIISGYALAFGIALIPAGRLGDRLGHKWVFFSGLALFTVASLACGLAASDVQLIVFRVVQGLAAGTFVPAVTAYIQILFPGRERGKAFAIMGAVIGASSALGPITGGLIIQAFGNANGWRLIFGVNVPIGIVALILAVVLIPGTRALAAMGLSPKERGASGGVDWIGLLLITGGLVGILVPLIEGQDKGWPLWTFLVLAAGILLIVLFGVYEVQHAKRGRSPLVPPHLFSHPAFAGGTVLALVFFATLAGRPRSHRAGVRPGLDAVCDRIHRHLVAECSFYATAWANDTAHRNRGPDPVARSSVVDPSVRQGSRHHQLGFAGAALLGWRRQRTFHRAELAVHRRYRGS
jgi:MFS family permease